MRRTVSIFMMILLAMVFYSPAHAAPPRAEKKTEKERLVLMPLKADSVDKEMFGAMETAVVEGLRDRYTVYSGERVAKKVKEIFAKESRAAKKECDAAMCMQDIAMAFQAELTAVVSVTKRPDGYFLALSIKNIVDDKEVDSKSLPCKGCDEYKVVEMLKTLAGGGTSALAGSAPAAPSPSKGKPAPVASPAVPSGDFSLDDLDGQAKAEEERKAAEKAKWDKYLSEMKKAFGQVEGYEKRDISKDLKVSAWEKFLNSYKEDDPYSTEDEEMREKVKVRIERLMNNYNSKDFLKSNADKLAREMPALNMEVQMAVKDKSAKDVIFQHQIHTNIFTCEACHPQLYKPEKGTNNIAMSEMRNGRGCGACHGRDAFGMQECNRCHTAATKKTTWGTKIEKF